MFTGIGAILGLVGSLLTSGVDLGKKWMDLTAKAQDQAHELMLLREHRATRGQEIEAEYNIADLRALGDMRTASYQHDASYGQGSQLASDALRMFRPVITILLMIIVALIYFFSGDIQVGETSFKTQLGLLMVDYLGMAIAWWFGDRKIGQMAASKGVK